VFLFSGAVASGGTTASESKPPPISKFLIYSSILFSPKLTYQLKNFQNLTQIRRSDFQNHTKSEDMKLPLCCFNFDSGRCIITVSTFSFHKYSAVSFLLHKSSSVSLFFPFVSSRFTSGQWWRFERWRIRLLCCCTFVIEAYFMYVYCDYSVLTCLWLDSDLMWREFRDYGLILCC